MIQLVFFKRPFLLICWEFHTCIQCILTNSTLWLPPSSLQILPANLIPPPCCCLLVALVLLPFFFLLLYSSSSSFSKCNPVSQVSSAHMCILRATHQRMDPEKWHPLPAPSLSGIHSFQILLSWNWDIMSTSSSILECWLLWFFSQVICSHGCCAFVSVTAMSCPKDNLSQHSSDPLPLVFLLPLFFSIPWTLGQEWWRCPI